MAITDLTNTTWNMTPKEQFINQLNELSDAINEKAKTSGKMTISKMAEAVQNIASYEQGYEAGSADALKDVTTLKGYFDTTKSTSGFFKNYSGESVEGLIKYGDTGNVIDMQYMFSGCTSLTSIPELDTSKVTKMNGMFKSCSSLTTIRLLDTSSVIEMQYMFQGCSNLTSIPLLDTSNVTWLPEMFVSCTSLTTIPLLNTSKVTNMCAMFQNCSSLTSIPALDTNNVTTMRQMFLDCENLTTIPLLNTSKVTNMRSMFSGCTSLTTIPLLDTSKVTDTSGMFFRCKSLTSIPALDTSKVTDMRQMFYVCSSLTTIPALDTSSVTGSNYLNDIFAGCSSLKTILMYGMRVNFSISSSTQFEASDLVTILNNLATVTSTRTLTMGTTNLAKLTDEQKAIATNKGWTLA